MYHVYATIPLLAVAERHERGVLAHLMKNQKLSKSLKPLHYFFNSFKLSELARPVCVWTVIDKSLKP